MRACFAQAGFADQFIAGNARCKGFCFFAKALRLLGKSVFEGLDLFEPATLHDTTSFLRVLTVGFEFPILIFSTRCPVPAGTSQIRTGLEFFVHRSRTRRPEIPEHRGGAFPLSLSVPVKGRDTQLEL